MSELQLLIFQEKFAKVLVIQKTGFKNEKRQNKNTLECQGQHEILYKTTKQLRDLKVLYLQLQTTHLTPPLTTTDTAVGNALTNLHNKAANLDQLLRIYHSKNIQILFSSFVMHV